MLDWVVVERRGSSKMTFYLRGMIGEELLSVSFLKDSVELEFTSLTVVANTEMYFRDEKRNILSNKPGWRDAVCSLISQFVDEAAQSFDDLILSFGESGTLRFSLRSRDVKGDFAVRFAIEPWELR